MRGFIQKYYKVVLAQLGAYGISWLLVTHVFLGPLPVVSPAFKENVAQSPQRIAQVAKKVPDKLVSIATFVRTRQSTPTTHSSGNSRLPSPWVFTTTPTSIPPGGGQPTALPTQAQSLPTLVPAPTSIFQRSPSPQSQPTSQPRPTARPQPTRPPTATPIPETPANLAQKEQATLDEINARRRNAGVAPVRAIASLTQAARSHAAWMDQGAGMSRCGHAGEGGTNPQQRARSAGYPGYGIGEIVACAYPTPKGAVDGWMSSPGHKAIMLSRQFRVVGIGWSGAQAVGVFGE
jgi:uncharacterized protein YkwD